LPPSREYPNGRFNNSVKTKDKWVSSSCDGHIQSRISLERNKTLKQQNKNEFGDLGSIKRRFYKKPDCQQAYKNYFCWINFPRCDYEKDLTLPTCRSACENFFISCGYQRDLWRCGKTKYFNGYEAEIPTSNNKGNTTYLRDYFPGQPFRQNKRSKKGNELPICTPAITGSASSTFKIRIDFYALLLYFFVSIFISLFLMF
jgi:hypothetical protein